MPHEVLAKASDQNKATPEPEGQVAPMESQSACSQFRQLFFILTRAR